MATLGDVMPHQAERPIILIDGPFGDYEKLVQEGHKTVNFYVNGEVTSLSCFYSYMLTSFDLA